VRAAAGALADVAARWASLLAPGGLLAGYFFFFAVRHVRAKGPPTSAVDSMPRGKELDGVAPRCWPPRNPASICAIAATSDEEAVPSELVHRAGPG
jgi:hypothetical protein